MLVTNTVIINDKEFKHTYSNSGMKIKRENVLYDEAYDPVGFDREYEETDIPIESEVEE